MGDIPLLGWLFRAKSKGQEKTNLFVFLTPHVIETPVEAETISKDLKKNMDDLREEHIKLYRGEKVKKPKKLENGKEKPE
jgi:general secretion pathway protein D